jgi:hypothetical protein
MSITDKNTLYAWYDLKRDRYTMVYPSEFQVKMCFPDGGKGATERGEGKIVKLQIMEVSDV